MLDTGRLAAGTGRGAERVAAGFFAAVFVLVVVNLGFVAQGGKDSAIQSTLICCQY